MKWLKEKVQKVLNWFDKKSALVMAIVAIIMLFSLCQTQEVLKLTRRSLELQRDEFGMRNRPYVIINNPHFAVKPGSTEGHRVEMYIENTSEIPANKVKGSHRIILNGKDVYSWPINQVNPAAIAKGSILEIHAPLQEDIYSAAMDEKNRFKVVTELTYSGMLREEADAYKTTVTVYYSVPEKVFKYEDAKYE